MAHVGAYSDISHLYFRDHLWPHPMPYFDYRFEYPVLTGLFVWLASFVHTSDAAYFLTSAVLLVALASASAWAIGRIDGSNPWLFAAAPALALYGTLNWDLLGICLLVLALLLLQRGRDGLGAAALALATWAKFFPIVVLPVILALRLADRSWHSAARIVGIFLAATLAVNLPFAITGGAQGPIRANWSYFFTFTAHRPPRATIWQPLLGHGADLVSTPLFAAGLTAIVILAVRARSRPGGSLIPGGVGRTALGLRDLQGVQPAVRPLDLRRAGDRRRAGDDGGRLRAGRPADLRQHIRPAPPSRADRVGLSASGCSGARTGCARCSPRRSRSGSFAGSSAHPLLRLSRVLPAAR